MSDLRLGTDIDLIGDVVAGLIAGEDLEPGLVTVDATTGEVLMANAGVGYAWQGAAVGFCAFYVSEGGEVTIFGAGEIHDAESLTPAAPVYLSATEQGGVTATAPATSGDLQQVVGQALSETSFRLSIDPIAEVAP
jgi:hypothetical protein